MLLDSCFESYQPYPTHDQYYYNQPSCPPSPLSHPPSPSFYSPSPSPYSPSSSNVFQFPPAPYTDITSTIKEELLPWTIPPASISSPSHTPTYCSPSPSPLLSQSATKPPPAIFPTSFLCSRNNQIIQLFLSLLLHLLCAPLLLP